MIDRAILILGPGGAKKRFIMVNRQAKRNYGVVIGVRKSRLVRILEFGV
jgi:hypothetical protein